MKKHHIITTATLLTFIIVTLPCACSQRPSAQIRSSQSVTTVDKSASPILVNKWHPIPKGYDIGPLITLNNGENVSERMLDGLQNMFNDMRQIGLYPEVTAGFRSQQVQQQLMDEKIAVYENEGLSYKDAKHEAEKWVAIPGHSEHELGLAVDINRVGTRGPQDSQEIYDWLASHAWKYGFILRYPKGKESITGTDYEAWHYRYVGEEVAHTIHERGTTLEEFLA